jgi:hypothetical protein
MFKWTPDNFDELLKSLGEVVVKMLDECPDGPRWIQKLRSMVLRLRAMGMEKVVGVDCTTHNTQSLVPSSSTPSSSRASSSRASREQAVREQAVREQAGRHFLQVNHDEFERIPDNFDEPLGSLGEVVVRISGEFPHGPPWIHTLRSTSAKILLCI